MAFSRREFCSLALLAAPRGMALAQMPVPAPPADIAAFERARILLSAKDSLAHSLIAMPPAPSHAAVTAHQFYSEDPDLIATAIPFRAQAEALLATSRLIATLTASYLLTRDERYALRAGNHLYHLLVDPVTRILPNFEMAGVPPAGVKDPPLDNAAGLLDAVPLAEITRSLSFLVDTAALSPPDLATARAWFHDLSLWLTTSRTAQIARDHKDRVASAWLLLTAASARMLRDEPTLDAARKLFRHPTLRNQVAASGAFPHEVTTAYPYRNTLQNFDLLAGACDLLSTPFENLWDFELADGPGMRSAAAYLYPLISDPARWPYPADAANFRDLPGRRAGLLLSGRAYKRAQYIALWKSLPYKADDPALRDSMPISEPLLWVTKPLHGA